MKKRLLPAILSVLIGSAFGTVSLSGMSTMNKCDCKCKCQNIGSNEKSVKIESVCADHPNLPGCW